jgi:hypothetical protein
MQYDCVSIRLVGRYQVEEKTEGIEHRRLNVADKWCAAKHIWIPERECPTGLQAVEDELLPWEELKNKIRAKKWFPRDQDLVEDDRDGDDKKSNGE